MENLTVEAPHFSISDGWWAEGFNEQNGWVIGNSENFDDEEQRDDFDSNSIYQTLEETIIPLYYDRDQNDIPNDWVEVAKEAIKTSIHQFSTRRMLTDYIEKMYIPALNL